MCFFLKKFSLKHHISNICIKLQLKLIMAGSAGKYIEFWEQHFDAIFQIMSSSKAIGSIQFNPEIFENMGLKRTYIFSVTFQKGLATNFADGGAISRDLAAVLLKEGSESRMLLQTKKIKINMDEKYRLWIQKI